MRVRAEEGLVRELARVVASFGVSQSLWRRRARMAESAGGGGEARGGGCGGG